MTGEDLAKSFATSTGVLQCFLLLPRLFNSFLTVVLSVTDSPYVALIGEAMIYKLAYVADIALIYYP